MVDLPSLGYEKSASMVRVQYGHGAQAVASAFGDLGSALDSMGKTLDKAQVEQANTAGENAVGRDPSGQLTVAANPYTGTAGIAYERAWKMSYQARLSGDVRVGTAELARDAGGDPAKFDAAYKGFRQGIIKNIPRDHQELRGPTERLLDNEYADQRVSIIRDQQQADAKKFLNTMSAEVKSADEDLMALAEQGGTDSDQFKRRMADIQHLYNEMAHNPMIAFSPREAELALKDLEGRAIGISIVGKAERAYQQGGPKAAQDYITQLETDTSIQLSPAERSKFSGMARTWFKQQQETDQADVKNLRERARGLKDDIESGSTPSPAELDQVKQGLASHGAYHELMQLNLAENMGRWKTVEPYMSQGEKLSLLQSAQGGMPPSAKSALDYYRSQGLPEHQAVGLVSRFMQESQLNTGARGDFREGHPTAFGIAQWRAERFTALKEFAASQGKPWTDFKTQLDFALHELRTSHKAAGDKLFASQNLDQAIDATYDYEGPAASRQTERQWQLKQVARITGGKDVQGKVGTTGEYPPPSSGTRLDQRVVTSIRGDVVTDTKDILTQVEANIPRGILPTEQDIVSLQSRAQTLNDPDLTKRVSDVIDLTRQSAGYVAASPLVQQQMRAQLEADGRTPFEQKVITAFDEMDRRREAQLQTDMPGVALNSNIPHAKELAVPVDFSAPENLADAISRRIVLRARMSETEHRADLPFLTEREGRVFNSIVASGPVQQAGIAMGAVAELPDQSLLAALDQKDVKDAIAGAARSTDPARYGSAMQAIDRMWMRAPQSVQAILGENTISLLQDWQGKIRYMNGDQIAEYLRTRDSPETEKFRKQQLAKGEEEARKFAVTDVVKEIGGTAPLDRDTRDTLMSDYQTVFADRFAATQDATKAKEQTVQRLRSKWGPSVLNDGRTMYLPPEAYYPAIGGSFDWMKNDIEADLAARGYAGFVAGPVTEGQSPDLVAKAHPYSLIGDRVTQSQVSSHQPPGYLVMTTDPDTGAMDLVKGPDGRPLRYTWNPPGSRVSEAEQQFQQERQRIFEGQRQLQQEIPPQPPVQTPFDVAPDSFLGGPRLPVPPPAPPGIRGNPVPPDRRGADPGFRTRY